MYVWFVSGCCYVLILELSVCDKGYKICKLKISYYLFFYRINFLGFVRLLIIIFEYNLYKLYYLNKFCFKIYLV